MSDLIPGELPVLIDQLSAGGAGSDRSGILAAASDPVAMQALGGQSFAEGLTQVPLVLDALKDQLLQLEPALTSLAAKVPAQEVEAMQRKAALKSWDDLFARAKQLTGELTEAIDGESGVTLEALGMESLALLQNDLLEVQSCVAELMKASCLDGPASGDSKPALESAAAAPDDLDALDDLLFGPDDDGGSTAEPGSMDDGTDSTGDLTSRHGGAEKLGHVEDLQDFDATGAACESHGSDGDRSTS